MITAFRLVRPRYAEDALSGEGARRYGGRWNSPGRFMVYASSSVPLATLELLVTIPPNHRVRNFRLIECAFPEAIVEELDRSRLPRNWNGYPPPVILQKIGDEWLVSRSSAVLIVPSAVITTENNYLINPEHADFRSVDVGNPTPFKLDPRLIT